jgi:predicted nucleic acid-binding protein
VSAAHVAEATQVILSLPISVVDAPPESAIHVILDLARSQGLTAYDATYLDLAMREDLPLASQDDNLRAAAGRVGAPLLQAP